MLYIFDLGNVIVDIDFNRVLGAWSDLTRIPLASLKKSFHMGEAFHQHERGEISDEAFAEALCHEMALPLSYEQFSHGWQAVFVALRPEVIAIMHKLREQGHRLRRVFIWGRRFISMSVGKLATKRSQRRCVMRWLYR